MAVFATAIIALLAVLFIAVALTKALAKNKLVATRAGGEKALDRLSDWAKWMAGIQTATLASLGLMIKDNPSRAYSPSAMGTVVFMGAALFCSAWVLSSIANISLALTEKTANVTSDGRSGEYDVYERPLYAGFKRSQFNDRLQPITLNFMVTLQHWLWALGLLFFAFFLLTSGEPISQPARIEFKLVSAGKQYELFDVPNESPSGALPHSKLGSSGNFRSRLA